MYVMKNLFIIDGIDGSGKDTQGELLKQYFESIGKIVFMTREPSDSVFGKMFRQNLSSKEYNNVIDAYLVSADRVLHSQEILKHLIKNEIVICNRYKLSTYAYQTLIYGENSQRMGLDDLMIFNQFAINPEVCIFLDIEPELAIRRIQNRNGKPEKFDKLQTLEKLRDSFWWAIDFENHDDTNMTKYIIIDVAEEDTPEVIHNRIIKRLVNFNPDRKGSKLEPELPDELKDDDEN